MSQKLKDLQDYMISEKIDVVYLDNPNTVAYFTNFESNPHERIVAYIVTQTNHFLFVPTLEKEEALKQSNVVNVYSYNDEENPWIIIQEKTFDLVNTLNLVCIDEESLTVARYKELQNAFNTTNFEDVGAFVDQLRVVKNDEEIQKMIDSGRLADEALQIGIDSLQEGISEQEVAAIIDMEMKNRGVSEMSFPTLVLFGDHAASPHGNSADRKLKSNEFVLFDLGVIYNGYASDVTRTIAYGTVSKQEENIYEVVLEAQRTAQAAVKPGMRAGELDQIARKVIEDAGYGAYFTHRLGHGIGKTAHEFPSIHGSNETILEPGMCFSIEPGIYIPGDVGVRIEDCVYVTADGCEPFTVMDKELSIILQ